MKKAVPDVLWRFTLLFLAAMFLPRLVTQGMFADGLLYSSMARNLAEGKGSCWAPFFSGGYWIDFASGNPYFENPPLMIWLQAGFFRLLGDFWWVEKLYALLLFVLNAWLIVRLWEIPLRGTAFEGKFGWLPLLFWYCIPAVVWGNPNNLMDNNLLTFCLLALLCVAESLFSKRRIWIKLTLAGLFVYFGMMTKGPVALYPIAVPFLFALAVGRIPSARVASGRRVGLRQLTQGFLQSAWMGLVAAGLFILMLALIPESKTYFENYWEKRLGAVLSGAREDAVLTGWARLSIFRILAKELTGVAVLFCALLVLSGKKKIADAEISSGQFSIHNPKLISLLYLLSGFAATLPLMLSARQSGMYIIAGLPMFALAAAYFHLPLMYYLLVEPAERNAGFLQKLSAWSVAGMFVLFGYIVFLFGKPGREKALLHDLPYIQQAIPEGEKVAVCEKIMQDGHAHTYLQRFHHLELTRDFIACRFALTDQVCDEAMQEILRENGFEKTELEQLPAELYEVYSKK